MAIEKFPYIFKKIMKFVCTNEEKSDFHMAHAEI